MPELDVSDIIFDPDFVDTFTVKRRASSIDANGRSAVVETDIPMLGVVTIGGLQPFIQEAEYVSSNKVISIHCRARLYDPTTGHLPDQVIWGGDTYVVKKVFPWNRYGKGFYAAECDLQTPVSSE